MQSSDVNLTDTFGNYGGNNSDLYVNHSSRIFTIDREYIKQW